MNPTPTKHAQQRMDQRGFQPGDIDIIVESGSLVRSGLHVLKDRDADRAIGQCKRRIQALERLRGGAAVIEDGMLITCFHISDASGRRALRGRATRRRKTRQGWSQ